MVMSSRNTIILGSGEYYQAKLREVLEAYSASGHPPVIFAEPQIRTGDGVPHAWIFRFYGLNFILEMIIMAADYEKVAQSLEQTAIVVNTLSAPKETTILPGGRVEI